MQETQELKLKMNKKPTYVQLYVTSLRLTMNMSPISQWLLSIQDCTGFSSLDIDT